MEEKKKRIFERLRLKYNDKERIPTAYERFVWLVNFLFPYFKTFKIIMTVVTPSNLKLHLIYSVVLILIWYPKNFKRVSRGTKRGVLSDLGKENLFYISHTIDLNYYETLLLRLSQLIFSVLGL